MEIADLTKFMTIARLQNLQQAANELDITPSALSKSVKRLENSLGLDLFDRIGKTIRLNDNGRQLQPKAAEMVLLYEQTRQQLCPTQRPLECKIAASAILQYRWASVISRVIPKTQEFSLTFNTEFEVESRNKLLMGEANLAIVTDAALTDLPQTVTALPLGSMTMQIAVGRSHPLATQNQLHAKDLLEHPFATPHISPFCGQERGLGCDGWRDQIMPRKTGWIVNDYSVISQLVKSGQAIAYLPDFLIREWQLLQLQVNDYPHHYTEQVYLLYRNHSPEWVKQIASAVVG